MKPWSSAAWGLLATASACRWASAAKAGEPRYHRLDPPVDRIVEHRPSQLAHGLKPR